MTNNLTDALKAQKKSTEQVNQQISGMLGIPLGGERRVEVPNRNAYVYVRLRNNQSEVIQAYNNQVSPSYNLPVLVERQGNRYVVVSIDTQRYENNWSSFASFLPRHGNTHSFNMESGGGADIVWVESKQLMPLLPFPSGSSGAMNVLVAPYTLKNDDGTWKYVGNTGTQDLTPYLPTGSLAVMGLVYVDSVSGNPYFTINSGTYFSNTITGSSQVYPYIPRVTNTNTQIPIAGIRLVTGTSEISWDNIYDVRQWLHTQPTGSAGGGGISSVNVQDEGAPAGTATTFNFVGQNVHASVSGSVVRVFVTGSAAGGFSGDANSVVLTDGAGALDTMPWLKWGTDTNEFIEFGADEAGKEVNAGRMGYNFLGDGYFSVVGAGTGTTTRTVKIYDDLIVHEELTVGGATALQGVSAQGITATSMNILTGTYNVAGSAHVHRHSDIIGAFLNGSTVGPTGTIHGCPFKVGADATSNSFSWPEAGDLSNMVVRISTAQPASGSLVATLFVNSSASTLVITIAAGSAGPANFSNAVNLVTISANDLLRWVFVNNATSTSAALTSVATKITKNTT